MEVPQQRLANVSAKEVCSGLSRRGEGHLGSLWRRDTSCSRSGETAETARRTPSRSLRANFWRLKERTILGYASLRCDSGT
jgi:hypothetical protein